MPRKHNAPISEIKPVTQKPRTKRPIGLAGKEYPGFEIDDAFFEPFPDDILELFNGEER